MINVSKKKLLPPPPNSHVIQQTGTIFELNSRIKETNFLRKFHKHWAKNVTYCVDKNAPPTGGHTSIEPMKTAPPTGGHTNILTNFKLGRDFIGTKLLTKFHEDGTRNVAYRVFTSKCTDGRTDGHTTAKDRSQKLT
ncbi:hypothetical protein DPMN_183731 [Dreissena polymorpha]|uniref:Uncharacterized protein n=1 Tax=Dreissena polymorpha TaxID=45954 RepID=A0A9D4DHX3_DREPO|nr:hypothetical protein DPMN_183731 [Dreissena polymorpha]